jgi:hypothetical protein
MNRYLAALSICCALMVRLALADDKTVTYVDLKGKFNYKPGEKIAEDDREGNFLTVPKGEQVIEGIRMRIEEGVVQLGSKVLREKPDKVEDIKVAEKFSKLHILHATGYGGGPNTPGTEWYIEDDTLIGEYRVNYEDKSSAVIPIEYGKDVRDWWFRDDEKETSRAKVAWKGDNDLAKQYGCRLRLYLTTWKNPKPDQKVISIDYIGRKDETVAAPFCVAMTLEKD